MIVTKKDKDSGVAQEYYTGVVNDDDLTKRLEKAGVEFKQEISGYYIGSSDERDLNIPANCILCRNDHLDDKAYVKGWRHDGRWQEQCQDVCGKSRPELHLKM